MRMRKESSKVPFPDPLGTLLHTIKPLGMPQFLAHNASTSNKLSPSGRSEFDSIMRPIRHTRERECSNCRTDGVGR